MAESGLCISMTETPMDAFLRVGLHIPRIGAKPTVGEDIPDPMISYLE